MILPCSFFWLPKYWVFAMSREIFGACMMLKFAKKKKKKNKTKQS
jgi:hypothetical protein